MLPNVKPSFALIHFFYHKVEKFKDLVWATLNQLVGCGLESAGLQYIEKLKTRPYGTFMKKIGRGD